MPKTPLLSAKNLTCIREDRILFERLMLDVYPGDIIQIEGPNGAGKTSLLRLLAGLAQAYDGQINYRQQAINQIRESFLQDLLYIGHKAGTKDELTAEENLSFQLALAGSEPTLATTALEQVQLLGFEDTYAGHLSAGQQRRIALARLWQTNAKIWILDEPFTAIDKSGVLKLEAQLLQHADRGGCVILTSHQDLLLAPERITKVQLEYRW